MIAQQMKFQPPPCTPDHQNNAGYTATAFPIPHYSSLQRFPGCGFHSEKKKWGRVEH
jgi:hypothetical protein